MTPTTDMKAVRTYKGVKATITVFDADGTELIKLGGNRAVRAQAVVVTDFVWRDTIRRGYEVRGDLTKAQAEAAKNAAGGARKSRGYSYEVAPSPSIALTVVDV